MCVVCVCVCVCTLLVWCFRVAGLFCLAVSCRCVCMFGRFGLIVAFVAVFTRCVCCVQCLCFVQSSRYVGSVRFVCLFVSCGEATFFVFVNVARPDCVARVFRFVCFVRSCHFWLWLFCLCCVVSYGLPDCVVAPVVVCRLLCCVLSAPFGRFVVCAPVYVVCWSLCV